MSKKDNEKIKDFMRHDKDNWSPEVQIANLSNEIHTLQNHLSLHSHDIDAKRSLLKKVARRRKFLKYLKEKSIKSFNIVSEKLNLNV